MVRRLIAAGLLFAPPLFLPALVPGSAHAGVVNPDISVLGQSFTGWTDDLSDPSSKLGTLHQGEVEGYFTLVRGLPAGLQLKGGKYRVGFGRMNPMHYGQKHIMSRRSMNSAQVAECSPTFLHMISSGGAL